MKPPLPHWALLQDASAAHWLSFPAPQEVIVAHCTSEVGPALREVAKGVASQGLWAVGLVAYEAAPGLDPALATHPAGDFPLLWFGLCTAPKVITQASHSDVGSGLGGAWQPSMGAEAYHRAIGRIHALIRAGETYQVNFTYRLRKPFSGVPFQLFAHLHEAQRPQYGAFLDLGDWVVCSASPELFFSQAGGRVECRPMKGTSRRGMTRAADQRQAEDLRCSDKERAENLMIVDMVRNDLGRIAEIGSVSVPELFRLERFPTLWQLTSKVEARTRADPLEVLAALFPAASITGAPKPHTMSIITELETQPRGLYTGTIGFVNPHRQAQFNVAIRTLVIDRRSGWMEYGTGGGVVWDSHPELELAESRIKARILAEPPPPSFSLIETLRWTPEDDFFLLSHHLARLRDSAEYFDFPCDLNGLEAQLRALARRLPPQPMRIRVLLDPDGNIRLERDTLKPEEGRPRRVALATSPVRRDDPFLYHKTTHRRVYEMACPAVPGADEVILFNEQGEITESRTANILIELHGERFTPPVDCGLLAGTYRAELLAQGLIRERPIRIEELGPPARLWLVNSVRGLMPVELVGAPPH